MESSQPAIKKGYKQTDVGVIPEDWEVKTVGNVCDFIVPGRNKPKSFDGDIPWITTPDIEGNIVHSSKQDLFVTREEAKNVGSKIVPKNSVIMSCVGDLGLVTIAGNDLVINQQLHAFVPNQKINSSYLLYALITQKNYMESIATKTAVPYMNKDNCNSIPIPIPPLPEQQAIAEVLSDVDTLITSLDQLITKKRNIKQGAMQLLLTGKKRLAGFGGEWETKTLGEIGEVTGAGIDKKIKTNEVPVRLVNYMDVYKRDFISSKHLNHQVTAPPAKALRCAVKKGDVFFTPSSEVRDDIGLSAVAVEDIPDAVYSYHVVRLRLKEDWDLAFRTYIFKTRYFLNQAEVNCDGSGTRYVISLKKFRELSVSYPKSIEEQKAIARILSDMDAEIEALEKKREKYKAVKQGLMQELLTGKTRLI